MAVSSVHPDYNMHIDEWRLMRDFDEGPETVKERKETYLPMPSGFTAQPDKGVSYYSSYQTRARVPELLPPTVAGMTGLIHGTEFQVEGLEEGTPLAYLWETATKDGLPLEALSEMVTSELLLEGRVGLLVDVPEEGGDPYIVIYKTESIRNWTTERNLYVLNESTWEPIGFDEFEWEYVERYRVLRLGEPPPEEGEVQEPRTQDEDDEDTRRLRLPSTQGAYYQQVYEPMTAGSEPISGSTFIPNIKGGKGVVTIPFVVGTPRGLSLEIMAPPLIGVARACLAGYQLDADYRHQLFWTGQETLVGSGISKEDFPAVVGAGVGIALQDAAAKVYYVGPSGVGIEKHKVAIDDTKRDAAVAAAQLFDQTDVPDESGKAKKLRYVAQTATLRSVAKASAKVLEAALRHAATFLGVDPETVTVTPNLDFVDSEMTPQDALALVQVWQAGALSYESIYDSMQRGRLASAERTAEEEQELIDEESPDGALPGGDLGVPPEAGDLGAETGGNDLPPEEGGGAGASLTAPPPNGSERFVEDGEGLVIEPPPGDEVLDFDSPDDISDEELAALFAPELLAELG